MCKIVVMGLFAVALITACQGSVAGEVPVTGVAPTATATLPPTPVLLSTVEPTPVPYACAEG